MNPGSLVQELTLLTGTPCTLPGKSLAFPARIQAYGLSLKLEVFRLEPQFVFLCLSQLLPCPSLANLHSRPRKEMELLEWWGSGSNTGEAGDCIPSRPPGLGSRPFKARKDHVGAGHQELRWSPTIGCERAMAPPGTPPQWSSPTQPFPLLPPWAALTRPQTPRAACPR